MEVFQGIQIAKGSSAQRRFLPPSLLPVIFLEEAEAPRRSGALAVCRAVSWSLLPSPPLLLLIHKEVRIPGVGLGYFGMVNKYTLKGLNLLGSKGCMSPNFPTSLEVMQQPDFSARLYWVQIPAPPLTSFVTLCKLLHLSRRNGLVGRLR